MDLKSGIPFWLMKSGLPFNYPTLRENKKTAVLVIGGGISGALAAWHLVNAGIETILVDKRTIGLGSTCASTALLQYELDSPLSELISKIGRNNAVYAYKRSRAAVSELEEIARQTGFDHFQKKDSLYYAAEKKDRKMLEAECRARKAAGLDVAFLSGDVVKNIFGIDVPAALLSKEAGQTNAYLFTHHLLQAAIKKGLQVFDRTSVADITLQKNGVLISSENGFTIASAKLVMATGYESVKYISKPVVKLHATFAVASEHKDDGRQFWYRNALIWNTADPYLYLRSTEDNRIIIGGRDEKYNNPEKRDKAVSKKAAALCADFKKLFPGIPFSPEFSWAGTFGVTKDSLPYIGEYSPMPGCYFALGYGGNGITFSQVAAKAITDRILGKANKDLQVFGFNR